jgi:G:T-mismatch repair DNA endonuclease (very short patch repair protein)
MPKNWRRDIRIDEKNMRKMEDLGFTVFEIWECKLNTGNFSVVVQFIQLITGRGFKPVIGQYVEIP